MKLQKSTWEYTEDSKKVIDHIVEYIYERLSRDSSMLLLVSGGSNIQAAVEVQRQLLKRTSLEKLIVGLIDERYGPKYHKNSNWQQLKDAGWNENVGKMLEVLEDTSTILLDTAETYDRALMDVHNICDETVAIFGIGSDGHTAGILPHSPIVDSKKMVDCFTGPDYERISITPTFMSHIDHGVVAAFGENKKEALVQAFKDGPVNDVPARSLAAVKSLIVYTDNTLD